METLPPKYDAIRWSRVSVAVGLALLGWLGWDIGMALPAGFITPILSGLQAATIYISGFLLIALALAMSGQRTQCEAQCQGGAQWRQRI